MVPPQNFKVLYLVNRALSLSPASNHVQESRSTFISSERKTEGRVKFVSLKPKQQKSRLLAILKAKRKFHRTRGNMPLSLFPKWAIGNKEMRFI